MRDKIKSEIVNYLENKPYSEFLIINRTEEILEIISTELGSYNWSAKSLRNINPDIFEYKIYNAINENNVLEFGIINTNLI